MFHSKLKSICGLILMLLCLSLFSGCSGDVKTSLSDDEYAPVSSLTVSKEEASALSGKMHVKVYYANESGTKLAAETHFFDYSKALRKTDALAKEMLSHMLENPQNAKLQKTLPEGTQINNVIIVGHCATVDLNSAFYDGLPSEEKTTSLILASVVSTLTELKEISTVTFSCDGAVRYEKMTRSSELIATLTQLDIEAQEAASVLDGETALE